MGCLSAGNRTPATPHQDRSPGDRRKEDPASRLLWRARQDGGNRCRTHATRSTVWWSRPRRPSARRSVRAGRRNDLEEGAPSIPSIQSDGPFHATLWRWPRGVPPRQIETAVGWSRPSISRPGAGSGRSDKNRAGAEAQNRTGDTAIFSRVLYQLSYLGTADDSIGREDSTVAGGWLRPAPTTLGRVQALTRAHLAVRGAQLLMVGGERVELPTSSV